MSDLTPYQVGENDVVLAKNPEEAARMLNDYVGEKLDPYTKDDTVDLTSKLDLMLYDEDREPICTLRQYITNLNEPQYLYGWE